MNFPTSYLPSNSLPWGRDVQNRIVNLETNLKRATVNGEARDTQMAATMSRVEAAVNSVISVEEAVFVPGTTEINGGNIAANTIAANKIAAGTMTGFTIQTDTTGQRVVLDGVDDTIKFYNSSDQFAGSIQGGTTSSLPGAPGITITGGIDSSYIYASDGYFGEVQAISISGENITASESISAYGSITSASLVGGSLSVSGTSNTAAILASGSISTDGGLTRTAFAGGGTTGASFNNNGTLIRTTSSERYKTDIQPLQIAYEDIIALEPKTFKRIEEVEENAEGAKTYPGFIAEELADTSLDVFVFRNQEGTPEGIHYAELSAALLSAIKTQHQMIESLTARIETLENK